MTVEHKGDPASGPQPPQEAAEAELEPDEPPPGTRIIAIRSTSSSPAGLKAELPMTATELSGIQGDAAHPGPYCCALLDTPIRYRFQGPQTDRYELEYCDRDAQGPFFWVHIVVLATTDPTADLIPGTENVPVHLAYVVNLSLEEDIHLDQDKIDWAGPAVADVTAIEGAVEEPPLDMPPPAPPAPAQPAPAPEPEPVPKSKPQNLVEQNPPKPATPEQTDEEAPSPDTERTERKPDPVAVAPTPAPPKEPAKPKKAPEPKKTPEAKKTPAADQTRELDQTLVVEKSDPAETSAWLREKIGEYVTALSHLAGEIAVTDIPVPTELEKGQPPSQSAPQYVVDGNQLWYHTRHPKQGPIWKSTTERDELVYWCIDDVARSLAWRWTQQALTFKKMSTAMAQRTLWAPYWQLLMSALNSNWGAHTGRNIRSLL